jgi:hypothetical protein
LINQNNLSALENEFNRLLTLLISKKNHLWFLTFIVTIGITIWRGIRQDYAAYTRQWQLIIENHPKPWANSGNFPNAYGPIHNLFAYLYHFETLLPKIVMVSSYLIVHILLLNAIFKSRNHIAILFSLSIFPFNWTYISIVASLGNNDSVVASLVGIAILVSRKKSNLAPLFLGLATLTKFYPILFMVYFSFIKRKFLIFFLIYLTTISSGMLLAYLKWGGDILTPIFFGSSREPRMFSIYSFLNRYESISSNAVFIEFLRLNIILVILVSITFYLYSFRLNWEPIYAASFSFFMCLAFYKVGNSQFYLTWLTLILGALLLSKEFDMFSFLPFVLFAQFLSIYSLGYELTGWYITHLQWVREYLGLIASIPIYLVIIYFIVRRILFSKRLLVRFD